jgi:hypothetical protein
MPDLEKTILDLQEQPLVPLLEKREVAFDAREVVDAPGGLERLPVVDDLHAADIGPFDERRERRELVGPGVKVVLRFGGLCAGSQDEQQEDFASHANLLDEKKRRANARRLFRAVKNALISRLSDGTSGRSSRSWRRSRTVRPERRPVPG